MAIIHNVKCKSSPSMFLFSSLLFTIVINIAITTCDSLISGTCGKDVTCFGLPSRCQEDDQGINCDILFRANVVNNLVNMEIKGRVDGNVKYFAVGLSDDTSMGDDAVFDCVLTNSGNVVLKRSNNVRKKNEEQDDLKGISSVRTDYSGEHVTCTWRHESKVNSKNKVYDLINGKYHVLLAKGPFKGNSGSTKGYHGGQKTSSDRLNFKSAALITSSLPSSSVRNPLLRAHAVVMILVWIPFVSIAILFARHFKNTFGETKFCGVHIWFVFHRTLMFLSVVSAVGGFIAIYQHVGGISDRYSNHQILGAISLIFMSFQVISALFRCHPTSSKRPLFNWFHFFGGNIAHIAALAALITSVHVTSLPPTFLIVLIAFIIVHVLIHLLLQCKSSSEPTDAAKVYPDNMYVHESRNVFEMERDTREASKRNRAIKLTFLTVYIISAISFATALIFIVIKTEL